jgi:hypothetical protein
MPRTPGQKEFLAYLARFPPETLVSGGKQPAVSHQQKELLPSFKPRERGQAPYLKGACPLTLHLLFTE